MIAGLQFIFAVQDELCRGNRIPAANKTFRLKYIFLAGKIIRTARYVVMKLSEKHPYQDIYEKGLPENAPFSCPNLLFLFKIGSKNLFQMSNFPDTDR